MKALKHTQWELDHAEEVTALARALAANEALQKLKHALALQERHIEITLRPEGQALKDIDIVVAGKTRLEHEKARIRQEKAKAEATESANRALKELEIDLKQKQAELKAANETLMAAQKKWNQLEGGNTEEALQ